MDMFEVIIVSEQMSHDEAYKLKLVLLAQCTSLLLLAPFEKKKKSVQSNLPDYKVYVVAVFFI